MLVDATDVIDEERERRSLTTIASDDERDDDGSSALGVDEVAFVVEVVRRRAGAY